MEKTYLILHFVIILALGAAVTNVQQAFTENDISPRLITVAPSKLVNVLYPGGAIVNLGNELTPFQVKDEPVVSWESEPGIFYTLIFTEPDAPTREDQSDGEVRHWLVVNIPNNSIRDGFPIAEYLGSGAPVDTGLHRYIFLIYKQPGRIYYDGAVVSNKTRYGRFYTSTMEFVNRHHLGDPEAGNFFFAQWDDYVPIIHAWLDEPNESRRRSVSRQRKPRNSTRILSKGKVAW